MVTEEEGRAAASLGFKLIGLSLFLGFLVSILVTEAFLPGTGVMGGILLWVVGYFACREFIHWVHRDKVTKMRATMKEYLEERGLADPKDKTDEE